MFYDDIFYEYASWPRCKNEEDTLKLIALQLLHIANELHEANRLKDKSYQVVLNNNGITVNEDLSVGKSKAETFPEI